MSGSVWRIPAGMGFADALAAGLLARTGGDPLKLADMLVLLPTRRACRTLQQSFLQKSADKALLLPRMMPLGDLDAGELALKAGYNLNPAIAPRQRQLLLAQLIEAQQPGLPAPQYLILAKALARLFDDAALEAVSLESMSSLVTGELATHWQVTLNFITPLSLRWQEELARLGLLDIAERRHQLLLAQAQLWREQPIHSPVIIAGSTGALPAIITLMQSVLNLPAGEVILPALPDITECADWWDAIDSTHPLAELKALLEKLETPLSAAQLWPAAPARPQPLLHHALRPATTTDLWAQPHTLPPTHLQRLDCANEQEEASIIALVMRETLEEAGRTAMLVTPDRNLGRRVASLLQRWSIQVDDSAGTPLAKTEAALFLRLILAHVEHPRDPTALLALLKHPMLTAGEAMGIARSYAQTIELEALRLRPPMRDLALIAAKLPTVSDWLMRIQAALKPLYDLSKQTTITLHAAFTALLTCAESLSTTDNKSGEERLWRGEAGQVLSDWSSELLAANTEATQLSFSDLSDYLLALQADTVVRPRYGEHPRLTILGPVEARLQQADRIILAGLNEGSWPAPPEPDPWLSRPMRKDLGLKSPEARLGQEAHDFYSLAAAPWVLLTRAARQDGTPTIPARWLSRLDIVVKGNYQTPEHDYIAMARLLDHAATVTPALPPAPRPPREARPRQLSVTQIEAWLQDPYALYAKKILRLKKLDPLDDEAGAAERGTFYHAVLCRFVRDNPLLLPSNSREQLLAIGEDELAKQGLTAQKGLWWPRFERLVDWFLEQEAQRRIYAQPLGCEVDGELTLPNGFKVTARADRIDRLHNGSLSIIDYKTGTLPATSLQDVGLSVQLPLEGAMAQAGGFKTIDTGTVSELLFWRLTGADPAGETKLFRAKTDVQKSIQDSIDQISALVERFNNDTMPYHAEPDAAHPPRFSHYRHLSRWKEWALLDEDEA